MRAQLPAPRLCFPTFLLLGLALAPGFAAAQQNAPALPPLPGADALPEVVARVDGDPITRRELLAQAQTMRIQAIQAGGGDPAQSPDYYGLVLDALIGERLVYADSRTRGVGPSEEEIQNRVQSIIAAYGGQEAFSQALAEQGLDQGLVRRQVEQNLSFDKVMQGEIVPGLEIGEQAMREYYEASKDRMKVPAYYKVRHIMKQVTADAPEADKAKARTQLAILRQQVVEGADFAELARVHSDDARTREEGGEMPWIVLTGREGSFEPAVAALSVGELSGVIETAAGIHLLRLEDTRPPRTRTFEEAQEEIRNVLGAVEAREEIQRRIASLRANAEIEILLPRKAEP